MAQGVLSIVAHSMGFAYALGMIAELQRQGYKIGWVYAIASGEPDAWLRTAADRRDVAIRKPGDR